MTAMSWVVSAAFLVGSGPLPSATGANVNPAKAQITLLYDAFGQTSGMQKGWGYAAFVEYGAKRILFDTGNNPDIVAQNAKAKGIDISNLDFVVVSTPRFALSPGEAEKWLREGRKSGPRCRASARWLAQVGLPG